MNNFFNKTSLLFLLFFCSELMYSQCVNPSVNLDAGNTQGFCAPIEINFPAIWPASNNLSTEYIFILHDLEEPYTLTDTLSYFHNENLPETISFSFETSSCNASGSGYKIDIYIKDVTCEDGAFNTPSGQLITSIFPVTIDGLPKASFTYEDTGCSVYTLTNSSIAGEQVEDLTCSDNPASVNWIIDADPSQYQVLDGSLGENELPGSDQVIIEFNEPGTYDVIIEASTCGIDRDTMSICVQDYNIDINELNFNFPDVVCLNETINLENDISSIFVCDDNNPWFSWQINPISVACNFEEDNLVIYESLTSASPSFSASNPGTYEIEFTTLSSCIIPVINTTHTITVKGIPQIDESSFDYMQACDLSADLTVDFDTCLSVTPYSSTWNIISGGSAIFSSSSEVNQNTVTFQDVGDFTLEYTLGSQNNSCGADTAYFDLSILDSLFLNLGNDTLICEGEDFLIDPIIFGGTPEYSYVWEDENGVLSEIGSQLNLSNIISNHQIILQVTDSNDCVVKDTIFITVESLPSYTLLSPLPKCEAIPLEISFEELIIPSDIVIWENVVVSPILIYNDDIDSMIHVTVTSEVGCSLYDSTQVEMSIIEDFDNLPDTIYLCSNPTMQLPSTITHPTINSSGVWSGDNVAGPDEEGNYYFTNESVGIYMVYYTIENDDGCTRTDSSIVDVSTNPSMNFTPNGTTICSPGESYIVFTPTTLENPISTEYNIQIYGDEGVSIFDATFNIDNPLPDTLFFELPVSSCDFNFDDSGLDDAVNGRYLIWASADNVCAQSQAVNTGYIISAQAAVADFNIDNPEACHEDSIYRFTNTSTGQNNSFGTCSDPDLEWEILTGILGDDWEITSGSLGIDGDGGSDVLDIKFLNPGTYDIMLTANSCKSDSVIKSIVIDSIPNVGVISDSLNICGPDNAFIVLSPETYENIDTTRYEIRVYEGDDLPIDIQSYTQLTLPIDSIMIDSITRSSCDFNYNDDSYDGAYRVEVLAFNKCDSFAVDTFKVYYSEAIKATFTIDNNSSCEDSIYTLINTIDDRYRYNNGSDCVDPNIQWEISGVEGVDWELVVDSLDTNNIGDLLTGTEGSDSLLIRFLSTSEYQIQLIANSACGSDTSDISSFIFEPIVNFGIDSVSQTVDSLSMSFCGDTIPYIILSSESYQNLDTTATFNISVYNENNSIQQFFVDYNSGFDDILNPDILNLSSLEGNDTIFISNINVGDTIYFDEINSSSCDFNYDDATYDGSYKIEILAKNSCDETTLNAKIFYSESVQAIFEIDDVLGCHPDSIYAFTNTSLGLLNDLGSCSEPEVFWSINGESISISNDWELVEDSIEANSLGDIFTGTEGSDTLLIRFLNSGSYNIQLTALSCSIDSFTDSIVFYGDPDLGIENTSNNICGPESAFVLLTPETYLNPDSTSYDILVYGGEDVLIDSIHFIQSTLPTDSILINSISQISCNFNYDDATYDGAYKVVIEAFNLCDSSSIDSMKFYYSDIIVPNFSIDSSLACSNSLYKFTNETIQEEINSGDCAPAHFYWDLSGIEDIDENGIGDWIVVTGSMGNSITPGTDFIEVMFYSDETSSSDIYDISLITTPSCNTDAQSTITESLCVQTQLDFILDEELITLNNDTVCVNTPIVIENTITDSQTCAINYLWAVIPQDTFCLANETLDYNLSNETESIPEITIFNPGTYKVICNISNDCEQFDDVEFTKIIKVLKAPEFTSFAVNYLNICDSNHISIDLAIDSCSEFLYSPIWQFDADADVVTQNDTFVEIIFADYENNTVQYSVANHCASADSVYVHTSIESVPDIISPNLTFCIESDYTLELENDSLNGSWSLNNHPSLSIDASGNYIFTPFQLGTFILLYSYTDWNGCDKEQSLSIIVNEDPVIDAVVDNQACPGEEVNWSVSPSGACLLASSSLGLVNITPSNPFDSLCSNSGTISADEVGDYWIYFEYEGDDGDGTCYSIDSMLFVVDAPDFSIVSDSIYICDGDTSELYLNINTIDQPYSLIWEPTGQTYHPIEIIPDESTTYVCTITDANNCVATDTLDFDVLCTNESLSNFVPFIIENQTETLFPDNSLFENVLYEGCTGARITFFKPECVDTNEDIDINYKIIKNGENLNVNEINTDPDFFISPSYNELFIPSDSSSVTIEIFTFNDYISEIPDTIEFKFDQISYSNCLISDTLLVDYIVLDQPDFNVDITDPFTTYCPGDDAYIEVFPIGGVGGQMIAQESTSDIAPYSFEWQHIGSTASQVMNPLDTTTYYVEVTDVCQYVDTASIEVAVNQYDDLFAYADTAHVCEDTLGQICATAIGGEGNYNYLWSNESSIQCIEAYNQIDPFTVTVTDGCDNEVIAIGYINKGWPSDPYFEYLPEPHVELGVEFYNYTSDLYDNIYSWDFGDMYSSNHYHPKHTYAEEGIYNVTLTVRDSYYIDCKREYSSYVILEPSFELWVPNSFTPNNDGLNDLFKPIIKGFDYYELIITDRWGETVFRSSDINESWDGYHDDKISPIGTYKCEVIYSKLNDIMKLSHYANINLIR